MQSAIAKGKLYFLTQGRRFDRDGAEIWAANRTGLGLGKMRIECAVSSTLAEWGAMPKLA
jgi:hypothetical protein